MADAHRGSLLALLLTLWLLAPCPCSRLHKCGILPAALLRLPSTCPVPTSCLAVQPVARPRHAVDQARLQQHSSALLCACSGCAGQRVLAACHKRAHSLSHTRSCKPALMLLLSACCAALPPAGTAGPAAGPPPASKKVVSQLPREVLSAARVQELGPGAACPVCTDELKAGDEVQVRGWGGWGGLS